MRKLSQKPEDYKPQYEKGRERLEKVYHEVHKDAPKDR